MYSDTRFVVFFVFYSVFTLISGHPAVLNNHNALKADVALEAKNGKESEPIISIDASSGFDVTQTSSQMDQLFASLGAIFSAMNSRINKLFSRLPANYDQNILVPIPNFQIPNIDISKANSTSITKFINGHKVTINDTDYKNGEGNESSFFHVRVVDIHPENGSEMPSPNVIRDIENIFTHESENENAISHLSNEEIVQLDPYAPLKIQKRKDTEWSEEEWNNNNGNNKEPVDLQNIETFDDSEYRPPVRDLSNDIYVNEILANSGAPTNPNAEFISNDYSSPVLARQSNKPISLNRPFKNNYYYYDTAMKPVEDLSNDIYVNDILANSGAPTNPDAEFIDFNKFRQPRSLYNLRKT